MDATGFDEGALELILNFYPDWIILQCASKTSSWFYSISTFYNNRQVLSVSTAGLEFPPCDDMLSVF